MRNHVSGLEKERKKLLFPFIFPAFLIYIVFFVFPAINALYYSLFDWSGFTSEKIFIGLKNFSELFHDRYFWVTTGRSFIIVIIGGVFIFGLAMIFSAFISSGIRFGKTFKNIIFFPVVIPPVAITVLWSFIYNSSWGLLNNILSSIGLASLVREWTSVNNIFWSMLVMIIWTYVGFYLVILMSAIGKIPQELYEVAKIEGANIFQVYFKITIPLIWDVLTVALVYWGIFGLKLFEIVYSFTGFIPKQSIWTLPVYLYIIGFGKIDPIYRLGYSTALSVMLFIFVMVFVIVSRKILTRETIEY